jgi:predicted Fe-Mo cluster-binding NifX family protein
MKVCLTLQNNSLQASLDPRFGRAAWYMVYNTETGDSEFFSNPNRNGTGGIGVQSGQLMSQKGVEAVITGRVGPNAFEALHAAGIRIYTGVSGSARDILEKFDSGKLRPVTGPTNGPQHTSGQ